MKHNEIDWGKTLLFLDSTIKEAIEVLNGAASKIVLVTDETGTLIGTISDGDIRRGLLKGYAIADSVKHIVNTNPVVVSMDVNKQEVGRLMLQHSIQQIPMIDVNRKVVGLHFMQDFFSQESRDNLFVVMAGGKGTRLLPKTKDTPKPMLKIAGKPVLEHIILGARNEGFRNFVISVNYLSEIIKEYFGDGSSFGVHIEYLQENHPLGTAGSLSLLEPLPSDPIMVTNGDVLTDVRYGNILDFHQLHGAFATMAVQIHEWQNPYGVVQTDGLNVIGYEEKPITRTSINAGVYVINPQALLFLQKDSPLSMPTFFEFMRSQGHKILAYPIHEKWSDIGRHTDLERVVAEMTNPGEKNDKAE